MYIRVRGKCVGVVVVLVGGGCGVGGMGVGGGVGVGVAGVFVRGGGGCVAGRMGLTRSMRRARMSGSVRSIVGGCGVVVAWWRGLCWVRLDWRWLVWLQHTALLFIQVSFHF